MKKRLLPKLTIISKIIITGILCMGIAGCSSSAPIKIGLAIELSGARGLMGIAIRNGATLAAEQINEQGGINGRPLELIIRDDRGDPETARQVDANLVEDGVVAIIGHATSQQTKAVIEQMNAAETILLSPTANSPDLTAKDDYFFRVVQTNTALGKAFGALIYEQGNQNLIGIIDIANQSYVETLWQAVSDEFSSRGGNPLPEIKFYSSDVINPKEIVGLAADQNPDAILIIASDIDTALLTQHIKIEGLDANIYGSAWAVTDELIKKGGAAVEGMILTALTNAQDSSERYHEFSGAYAQHFGVAPGLGASNGYEAIMILAEALRQTNGSKAGLREALLSISNFQGVHGTITFDESGDVYREAYLVQVKEKKFVTIVIINQEGMAQ